MKRFFILFFIFLSFAFDIIFFDYDLSDIMNIKEDVSEINKKLDESLDLIFPFYFKSVGFEIKNCRQLEKYELVATNPFEESALLEIEEKCQLKGIINKAKISKIDFIGDIKFSDLKNWDKKLYINYGCEKVNQNDLKKYEIYNNGEDLEKNNIIKIIHSDDSQIIFINNDLNRMFFIKEILKANFNNDKTKDILLKISVLDESNSYIKCIKYVLFTRNSDQSLLTEKNIE